MRSIFAVTLLAVAATSVMGMDKEMEEDFGTKGITVVAMSWLANIGIWLQPVDNNCYNFAFYFTDMIAAFIGADYESFVAVAQTIPLFTNALTYGYPCFQDMDFAFDFDWESTLLGSFFSFSDYDFDLTWNEGILLGELFT